ncbi:unannotated protein [freshwater metagenome]|uniref:Unannotated protein n=1 Tax=freshwater metagenome TaxID=449393 RepID=A0A6J7DK06_9ZZZZ
MNDGGNAIQFTIINLVKLGFHLAHAGQHAHDLAKGTHFLDRLHLLKEVIKGEILARRNLACHPFGLFSIKSTFGLLDQGEHVAHVKNARSHAIWMEHLKVG